MQIIEKYINKNLYSIKAPKTMKPKGICVHNTYNNASAKNEISYMTTNNKKVSYHVAIDEKEIIIAIPFNRTSYACGDTYGNENYIQIEICKSNGNISDFKKAEVNTSKYIAQLMFDYGFNINDIKSHKSFSGKNCPHKTMELGWNRFINMIKDEYNLLTKNKPFLVKVNCDVLNVRESPTTSSNITTKIKRNEVYTIIEKKGEWGKLKSGVGWIHLNYVIYM